MVRRTGRCTRPGAALLVAGLSVLAAVGGCGKGDTEGQGGASTQPASGGPLLCSVGGTMRPAMEKLAADYEKATGQKVEIDYAGSGELLTRIVAQKRGDLYVCHDPFQDRLAMRAMSAEGWTLAVVTPMIAVPKGNPKKILSVKDLARPGLKLAMTHPTHSTTGWIIPRIFEKAGLKTEIEANIVTRTRGGGESANRVALGNEDAAIVWDAVIRSPSRRDKLDAVAIDPPCRLIPGIDTVTSPTKRTYDIATIKVTMDLLTCSKQPEAARKFAEYARKHRDVFVKDFGFSPAPPEPAGGTLQVHCGAGIRLAMEDAVATFQKATGAKVEVSYQGSGTLITTIRLKRQGDLYMPGDVWYLDQLAKDGSVPERKMVAWFVPVILTPKGNPKGIRTLADLVRPGVKLGVGNPKACQIGRLTEQIFAKNHIDPNQVARNTTFSSVTVNELGVKAQTGSIDAAIIWDAVAASFARDVEIIPIPLEQNLISKVAIGLLTYSKNRPLARRFMDFLAGPEGKAIFAKHQYTVEEPG